MKILKIEFQNINSLKGTHSIDFTAAPFTTNSLFAITGPTGSGKSTILDVISLALFNHVPRLGKISKNEIISKGAILTKNQKEAFAKVTYECKTGIFSSTWGISTARTGALRDYDMEIVEEATGNILDLKKSDVPSKNEELIGLNYNQFIKSVLLAQGEFAQFLKARKEERGEMLEKITGTAIYRQLGKMAFEKFKSVNKEIQQQQDEINLIERDLIDEEQLLDLTEEYSKKENLCKPLAEEINVLTKKLELKKTIEDQLKEIDKITSEKKASDLDLKGFEEEYGFQLKQHEKVRDVAEELRKWSRLTLECADIETEHQNKSTRKEETVREIKNCLKEISGFTKLEVVQENVEAQLQEFSLRVTGLQEKLKEKHTEYRNLQNQFKTETRELPCELDEKDVEKTFKELKELKKNSEEKTTSLQVNLQSLDLQNPELERSRLKKELQEARAAQEQADKISRITANLERLDNEEERVKNLLKDLPNEIRHSEDQVKIYRGKLDIISLQRQNQLLMAGLKEHRKNLNEGEPCPLCGALHHPFTEGIPKENNLLDDEIKQVERELVKWTGNLTSATTTLNHHNSSLTEINKEKDRLQLESKQQQKDLQDTYQHLKVTDGQWKKFCEDQERVLEDLEIYQKEKKKLECVETGLPLLEQMRLVSHEGKALREKLVGIYKGNDIHQDTSKFLTRWTKNMELKKAIDQQLVELKEKINKTTTDLHLLEKELVENVTQRGFDSLKKAGEALLKDTDYIRLYSGREKIQKEITGYLQSLKILNSQLEKSRKLDVDSNADELNLQKGEKNSELEKLQQECQQLQRKLLNDRDNRERLKKIQEKISEKEKHIKRWKILNELIGDSSGKKFNDFAQDLSLGHLIQLANHRLKDLSDRYMIDKPVDEEDDGLVAVDEHMGGQRRSVKTLSGGETFLLSLSMALALSDLASRNVEINSLFIDEGFGTLDPETLDQTLDTLEKLQAESSKTIGIISHVDALKERIATQIKLKRNGQGYSSLEVR